MAFAAAILEACPVRTDIADPQRGELGQPEPGVEQHERQRPFPFVGKGEEAPQLGIGQGGDKSTRHLRSPKPSEATRRGDLLDGTPVAEGLETTDTKCPLDLKFQANKPGSSRAK